MGASLIIRRIHLYLALFLTPWMLMYAISTVVMNHRGFFKDYYGEHAVQWEIESDTTYDVTLGPNISREVVANQILSHLGIEGAHNTQGRLDRRITITRDNPWATRRVTFSPASGNLKVERRMDRVPVILESLHRRRGGYQHPIVSEHLWSVVIDLVIGYTKGYVAFDSVIRQKNVLWNIANVRLPVAYAIISQRVAVNKQPSLKWSNHAENQICQC